MKRVLVVDDEPVVRALVAASLEGQCEVQGAGDGAAAMASIASAPPDLILLDIGLPGVSGADLLRKWRADSRTADIPVLLLTGLQPSEELRPDGVLLKPFTPLALRSSVAAWL